MKNRTNSADRSGTECVHHFRPRIDAAGPDRARAILEWETMQGTALLRVGAAVSLVAGGFMAFAVTGRAHGNRGAGPD